MVPEATASEVAIARACKQNFKDRDLWAMSAETSTRRTAQRFGVFYSG